MGAVVIGVILIVVGLVVATALMPVIRSSIERAITNGTTATTDDMSGTDASILRLTPTLFAIGIMIFGAGLIFVGLKGQFGK